MPGTKSKHLVLRTYTFQKFFFSYCLFVKIHLTTSPFPLTTTSTSPLNVQR